MLGDSILVAPIFKDDGQAIYYLPKGRWTHLFTGDVVEGGTWRKEKYDYMSLPLFVKANTILPIGSNELTPEYAYAEDVTFCLYELEDGKQANATVNNLAGEAAGVITISRSGQTINIEADMGNKPYSINLIGHKSIQSTTSGEWSKEQDCVKVVPDKSVAKFTVTL